MSNTLKTATVLDLDELANEVTFEVPEHQVRKFQRAIARRGWMVRSSAPSAVRGDTYVMTVVPR